MTCLVISFQISGLDRVSANLRGGHISVTQDLVQANMPAFAQVSHELSAGCFTASFVMCCVVKDGRAG